MTGRPHAIQLSEREARLAEWVLKGFQRIPDASADTSRTVTDVLIDRLEQYWKGAQRESAFPLSDQELRMCCLAAEAMIRVIEAEGGTPPGGRVPALLLDLVERLKGLVHEVE